MALYRVVVERLPYGCFEVTCDEIPTLRIIGSPVESLQQEMIDYIRDTFVPEPGFDVDRIECWKPFAELVSDLADMEKASTHIVVALRRKTRSQRAPSA